MLEAIGENAERESACFGDCFFASAAIGEHTRQIDDFADPKLLMAESYKASLRGAKSDLREQVPEAQPVAVDVDDVEVAAAVLLIANCAGDRRAFCEVPGM